MRKNSLGMQGAVCLSSLLLRNETLQALCVTDNDLGTDGGQCIGVALKENTTLKVLKIAENELGNDGAITIIKGADNLESLNLAKNGLQSEVGKPLAHLLTRSTSLKKLALEYN